MKKKYEIYRKELTYYLFNYLENDVQKKSDMKSPLYEMIYWEYCKKYNYSIPFVLNSLYEIVQQFICFFPTYIEEMEKIKNYLKVEMINGIKGKIVECQKLEYYPYIKGDIDDILNHILKRIELLFDVAPEEKIDDIEKYRIQSSFVHMIKGVLETYKNFELKKDLLIESLESEIQKIKDPNTKTNLLLELLPLYETLNIEDFYRQMDKIKALLPPNSENLKNEEQKKLMLKNDQTFPLNNPHDNY